MAKLIITKEQYSRLKAINEAVGTGKFKAGDQVTWTNKKGEVKTGTVIDRPTTSANKIWVELGKGQVFSYDENAFTLAQPTQPAAPSAAPSQAPSQGQNVSRGTSSTQYQGHITKTLNNLYSEMGGLFKFIVANRGQAMNQQQDSPEQQPQQPVGSQEYSYEGHPVKVVDNGNPKWGQHLTLTPGNVWVEFKNGNIIQVEKSKVDGLTSENYYRLSEGRYVRDKDMSSYLNKNLSQQQVKTFEGLMFRVELIRNQLRKLENTGDSVVDSYLQKLKTNPIIATDFDKMLNIAATNPQTYENFAKFIQVVNNRLYTGTFKGENIVDKMATLGKMNIQEDANFDKSAQSKKAFKENLFNFISLIVGLYQYLFNKRKKQTVNATRPPRKQAPAAAPAPAAPVSENDKLINEEIKRIKNIMNING